MNPLIEYLFSPEGPAAGEGRLTALEHTWPWPAWVTVLLVVAGIAYVLAIYFRERPKQDESGETSWLKRIIYFFLILLLFVPTLLLVAAAVPSFPASIGIAAAVVIALLAAWVRFGERAIHFGVLPALRAEVILLLLFMMHGYVVRPFKTDLPDLIIAIDVSGSMATVDTYADSTRGEALAARTRAVGLADASRINLAKSLLLEKNGVLLAELAKHYRVKLYTIGDAAQPVAAPADQLAERIRTLEARDEASRLGAGARQILEQQRGRPTAAMVVLTDGITSEGETIADVAEYARRRQVPFYVVALGNPEAARDIRVHDLLVDPLVFVDDLVPVEVKITATGYEKQRVRVRLREKGKTEDLAAEDLILGPSGKTQPVKLKYTPREPRESVELVVDVEVQPGEINRQNNSQSRTISIRDETIRVLLVQAYPSYEFRYLKSLLERATKGQMGRKPAVHLTTVLQEADPEYAELDATAKAAFPVRREELLEKYDVVIFGDVNPTFLSPATMTNLADFVKERGGGLAFIAGPRYTPLAYRDTPLAELFPIDLNLAAAPPGEAPLKTATPIVPTRLGLATPQMQLAGTIADSLALWQKMPGVYWMLECPAVKPGAHVLAEHASKTGPDGQLLPAIVMQFVGNGKVLFQATDDTWRWRFRVGDAIPGRYWLQTVRYLSRSKLLGREDSAEITTDRQEYRRGESVRVRVRFLNEAKAPAANDGVTIVLEQEGAAKRRLQLRRDATAHGVFEGTLPAVADGTYHAWVATPSFTGAPPSTTFTVVAPPGEQARLETDEPDLRSAAEKSRGRFYTLDTASTLATDLPPGREVPIEALPPRPVWNAWQLVALLIGLIVTEWLVRKDVGLL